MSLRLAASSLQRACPTAFAVRDDAAAGAVDAAALTPGEAPAAVRAGDVTLRVVPAPTATGPLAGSVHVVTGAASGLGLGIARGLHAAGAGVLFTDVDQAGLEAVTAPLGARAAWARMDVTSEASVAAAFDTCLERFGRVDGAVCAAGIAPAFPLTDFPLDKWELSLRINLTGYFLVGREAVRIMKAQGRGGALVLLSSKSGLEPSKNNSAYNATKAGELHLARGWALELGRDGIRVNCIAPGNVFEGSKIWNPTYIAERAKAKGIKPEDVIPSYIAMTALNRDIKPNDIANAAVWLLSDQARCMTGQVLVVDSGQVWAR
jgi:NAD(P)-dependent dehydrogenase (short-subunit alcohol dehydrogenase family)